LFGVSFLEASAGLDSAAGAETVSAGFGLGGFAVAPGVAHLAASVVEAMVSILKSLAVGGGTLAGSGRGTAASIASSAGLVRGPSLWASAEVADTARKVAATAISTRSNPARLLEQSRIVTFPRAELLRHGTAFQLLFVAARAKAPASI